MKNDKSSVKNFIKNKINELGMSQREFAARVEMNHTHFRSNLCRGMMPPNKLGVVAKELKTTVDNLKAMGLKVSRLRAPFASVELKAMNIIDLVKVIANSRCKRVSIDDLEFLMKTKRNLGIAGIMSPQLITELLIHRYSSEKD